MAEEEKDISQEETPVKTPWQTQKENWYDKIPLTVKQLDVIIGICFAALAVTVVFICLDAMDIFHLFG